MTCHKIEKKILNALEENKNLEKIYIIQNHLNSCEDCNQFLQHLSIVKKYSPQLPTPPLSNRCLQKTSQLCLSLLNNKKVSNAPLNKTLTITKPIPKFAGLLVTFLILVTILWFIFVLSGEWRATENFDQNFWPVIILLQNMFMSLFAPLLIKYFKKQTLEKLLS